MDRGWSPVPTTSSSMTERSPISDQGLDLHTRSPNSLVDADVLAGPTDPVQPDAGPAASLIRIEGGHRLQGTVTVGGSKNLMLPAFAAALLTSEPCEFDNVPAIEDTRVMLRLLQSLGADVDPDPTHGDFFRLIREHKRVVIEAAEITSTEVPVALARAIRASFLVVAPLLVRAHRASSPSPGGDLIGSRPIDVAVRGLQSLGATAVSYSADGVVLEADRLVGEEQIYLDYPAHTGTEVLLMAAARAVGTTNIINAPCEPEVVAFGHMLRRMGANIEGLGSPHIKIQGVPRLHGVSELIMPDRLVAGTFAIAAAMTGGDITIQKVVAADMLPVTHKLRAVGATALVDSGKMFVRGSSELRAVDVQALPFPGFPTDQQAMFAALLTQAQGVSNLHERVYENRLGYVEHLQRMGADIQVKGGVRAEITGPTRLTGASVEALDIRAGATLVLAGLVAGGETVIADVGHLARGYEEFVVKLNALGAHITESV